MPFHNQLTCPQCREALFIPVPGTAFAASTDTFAQIYARSALRAAYKCCKCNGVFCRGSVEVNNTVCYKCNGKTFDRVKEVPPGSMQYFECVPPSGNGVCSDNACPCPETAIPRGFGYLYVDASLIAFRKNYPGVKEATSAAMSAKEHPDKLVEGMNIHILLTRNIAPILMCERGARLRCLDLEVAAEDAKEE